MIGDSVYKEGDILLGTVSAKTVTNGAVVITIDDAVVGDFTQLINGDFIYGKKDLRIDGSALRGYVFRVDLEDNSTTRTELFGIAADVSKSYQ